MRNLITDEMVAAAAEAFANHEYRINGPEMTPYCTCGQAATFRYDVDWYDQHVARLTLEVVAPLVAANALRDAAEVMRRCKDWGHWNLRDPRDPETSYSPDVWLCIHAGRIERALIDTHRGPDWDDYRDALKERL